MPQRKFIYEILAKEKESICRCCISAPIAPPPSLAQVVHGARCVAQFPRQVFGSFSAAVLARRHSGDLTHGA